MRWQRKAAMPKPYSTDLRERVLAACERGEASRAAVARRFSVSEATIYNWLRQAREEGRREAKPHAGGPAPKVDANGHAVIRTLVKEDNAATLAEYVERYAARTGQRISRALMCGLLRRLDLPRKKRRSGPRSGIGPRSWPSARATTSGSRSLIRPSWCSSTRPGSRPG